MEIIYRKHTDKSTRYVFIFCTTNGWWGLCGFCWGELVAVKENIPLEMRGSLGIGGEEAKWHKAWRNEMERNWLLIVGGLAKLLTEMARVSPVGG